MIFQIYHNQKKLNVKLSKHFIEKIYQRFDLSNIYDIRVYLKSRILKSNYIDRKPDMTMTYLNNGFQDTFYLHHKDLIIVARMSSPGNILLITAYRKDLNIWLNNYYKDKTSAEITAFTKWLKDYETKSKKVETTCKKCRCNAINTKRKQ